MTMIVHEIRRLETERQMALEKGMNFGFVRARMRFHGRLRGDVWAPAVNVGVISKRIR